LPKKVIFKLRNWEDPEELAKQWDKDWGGRRGNSICKGSKAGNS
jgi:hypothetical protein